MAGEYGQVLKKIKIIQYWIWKGFPDIYLKKSTIAALGNARNVKSYNIENFMA